MERIANIERWYLPCKNIDVEVAGKFIILISFDGTGIAEREEHEKYKELKELKKELLQQIFV